jgi:AcrR family transcriptional regulator
MLSCLKQEFLALTCQECYTSPMDRHDPRTASAHYNTSAGPRRRSGGRSARVRAAVVAATIQLLQEKGYEALSFATIAQRAGVHETSLYRRWKTKEQLIVDAISSETAKNIPVPNTGALRSDLIQLLQYLRIFLQSSVGQAIVQTAIVAGHVPSLNSFHREYWPQRHALLQPLFERAIARGELSPQTDVQLLFEMLIGAFYVRAFGRREPLDETLPERIVDLMLSGVGIGNPTE